MHITIENFIDTLEVISNVHDFDLRHGKRTSAIACAIGLKLNGGQRLTKDKLLLLDYAARVHDIGRVGIDNSIIAKNGKLTKSQRAAMQAHCQIGFDFLSESHLPYEITGTVLCHHEHWDGTGYPRGLKGLDIPLFARIVCIADTYDGIVSERPYHRASTTQVALNEMNKVATWFDPKLYTIFLEVIRDANGH